MAAELLLILDTRRQRDAQRSIARFCEFACCRRSLRSFRFLLAPRILYFLFFCFLLQLVWWET